MFCRSSPGSVFLRGLSTGGSPRYYPIRHLSQGRLPRHPDLQLVGFKVIVDLVFAKIQKQNLLEIIFYLQKLFFFI